MIGLQLRPVALLTHEQRSAFRQAGESVRRNEPGDREKACKALSIAYPTYLAQGQPDLQSTEAPRVLRPVFKVIDGGRLLSEVVIGRMVAEGIAQRFRLAHQGASSLQRSIQPL